MSHPLTDMISLDIYLSQKEVKPIATEESLTAKSSVKIMPIKSWDIYSTNYHNNLKQFSSDKKNDIKKLNEFALTLGLQSENLTEILQTNSYKALVLTDASKKILWVNDGFTEMTGYPKKQVINNTPAFLQGRNTSESSRQEIREKLSTKKPFKAIVINYKKDNTPYKCELNIFPLYNDKTVHYLALEREAV